MIKKHTKEEWLEALELYKKGYGSTIISRLTGLDGSDIRRRIRQYLVSGIWQTEIKRPVRASPSIKKNAVDDVVSQSLSYAEVVVKYGISFDSLKTWLRKYRHGGYEELLATRPKGRPPKMNKAKPKRTALATAANADVRYKDRMFEVDTTKNVVYATGVPQLSARHNLMAIVQDIFKQNISFYANETDESLVDLKMDIYSPKNDGEKKRAAVIVAHGGSFVAGAKDDTDQKSVAYCGSLAALPCKMTRALSLSQKTVAITR